MGLEDKSLARFWVSSLRACKEREGEGHRRNASFHAEQACQCKISSSLPFEIIFAYFYLQAAYQPVFFINDCWNFTCVIFPQHIALCTLLLIWATSCLFDYPTRAGPAKGRVVCEGWPPSSSLPFFHIPTHHKWRTAPLTSCLLARQSGSIIYTPLNCTVSYNSYVPYRLLWNTVQEHFTHR